MGVKKTKQGESDMDNVVQQNVVTGRIGNNAFKRMVVQHAQIKAIRDDLLHGTELPEDIGANPMAIMGLVGKVPDLKRAFLLTRELEEISSQLIHEQIMRIAENG